MGFNLIITLYLNSKFLFTTLYLNFSLSSSGRYCRIRILPASFGLFDPVFIHADDPTGLLDPVVEVRPVDHQVDELLKEIRDRLRFMVDVGLSYLTIDRISSTLSGGETQRINLTRTLNMCKAALPHLLESRGSIVNAASTAALTGLHWGAAYSASKGGVLAFTRSVAVEYAKQGVRANCVCPGDIKTPMTKDISMPDVPSHEQIIRISALEEKLPEHAFLRIHRSFIVAKNRVHSFTPRQVEIGERFLPIGRLYKEKVLEVLGEKLIG